MERRAYSAHVGSAQQRDPLLNCQASEDREIDLAPSRKEIEQAIKNKKNKKATSDWENEILKKGGEAMIDMLMPVIRAFWEEEKPPKRWNQGIISNVWKGKGDREKMENQRGITVSSSVGTIAEEILTKNGRIYDETK